MASSKAMPFTTFCTKVVKLRLSPAWRVLLSVAIDGVQPHMLSGEDRELARTLFGDVDEVSPAARQTLVWRLGRGSGKTTFAAALGLWIMLTAPLKGIGPGMVPAAVTVAPGTKTAKLSVRVARALVRGVPELERLVCGTDTAEGFSLKRAHDGRQVEFVAVAASRGGSTLRGYDILVFILDESEFFSSNEDVASADGYAVSDRDLFAAARPRLHGPAVFISTPWPVPNLTAELFDANHGHPEEAFAARGPSTFMRPDDERLARDVPLALAGADAENAEREYNCVPGVRGGSRFFDVDAIDAAIVQRPHVIEAPYGASIGAGGDLGLERDSSAIAVVGSHEKVIDLLECDEIRPAKGAPLTPGYVIRDRFGPIMVRHGAKSITMDAHYRQSAIEHLTAISLRFMDAPTGVQGKYDSYMKTRSILREARLRIPPIPRLVIQLKAITSTPLPGGGTRITAPRRAGQGHGDIVSALVNAIWDCQEGSANRSVGGASAFKGVGTRFNEGGGGFQDWSGSGKGSNRLGSRPRPNAQVPKPGRGWR